MSSGWGRPEQQHPKTDSLALAVWLIVEQLWKSEDRITHRMDRKMSAAQDAVDAVAVQLGKAKDEILNKIADLEAQVAAGETPNLEPLKAAAQALDDVVPDVVEEPPVV